MEGMRESKLSVERFDGAKDRWIPVTNDIGPSFGCILRFITKLLDKRKVVG